VPSSSWTTYAHGSTQSANFDVAPLKNPGRRRRAATKQTGGLNFPVEKENALTIRAQNPKAEESKSLTAMKTSEIT